MHGQMNDECVPDGNWCPPYRGAQLSSRGHVPPPPSAATGSRYIEAGYNEIPAYSEM